MAGRDSRIDIHSQAWHSICKCKYQAGQTGRQSWTEATMEFGYFTLSDNNYADSDRSANQFITEIREQAIRRMGLDM